MVKTVTLVKKINFFTEDIDFTLAQKGKIREWIANIILEKNYTLTELNYIFVSDAYLLQLNREQLQHDFYTDIITFPYNEPGETKLHSDIYISIDRVKENAVENGSHFTDELHRVMIHGVLHLVGFDDHDKEKVSEMRKQEDMALQKRQFLLTTP